MLRFVRRILDHHSISSYSPRHISRRRVYNCYGTDLRIQVCMIADMLKVDRGELTYDFKRHNLHNKSNPRELEANVRTLLDYGFSENYIYDYLHWIAIPALVLKNRLQILEECGCPRNKTAPVVLQFSKFSYARTPMLRAYGILPSDVKSPAFLERLLSYLDLQKEDLLEEVKETHRILDIYNIIYKSYLFRVMPKLSNLSEIEICRKRGRYTSLRNYKQNVKFLIEGLKFNCEEIVKYQSLLFVDCGNMMALLQSSHGIRIKELIPNHPELLDILKDRYDSIYKLIKGTKIDFNVFLKLPTHFTSMNFKEFEYHFTNCVTSPYLSVFKYHHKLPLLVERSRIASERVHILKHLNMKCYNLNILIGETNTFLRYVSDGTDKVNADDTFLMLSRELDKPLSEVRKQLKKSNFIEYVSIAAIKENLDYLREVGFDDADIWRNIQLVLYPKEIIHDNVMKIHLGELSIYVDNEKLTIDRKYYLSLALYTIEKEHNFTSSFLWKKEEKIDSLSQSASDILIAEI